MDCMYDRSNISLAHARARSSFYYSYLKQPVVLDKNSTYVFEGFEVPKPISIPDAWTISVDDMLIGWWERREGVACRWRGDTKQRPFKKRLRCRSFYKFISQQLGKSTIVASRLYKILQDLRETETDQESQLNCFASIRIKT